ncbi:HugZ family protein [Celeribacter indicus]|uniref:Uncharacterized protein n=1 Tax=Celeribacter indicus TaxID=1208324 RepID=A0A0B5E7L8_9RHOB|nr:pyridoxamine 5'-phosphate oxidase family protein [Celeribacter indicus]AJE48287.1 hypothetical protein P73_3572 [Celeribacter indicus]SDW71759.1 hypothetical protein SAMN05443573_106117 [Celeribacter indicus]
MTDDRPSPIRPTDDEARGLARKLVSGARIAALAVTDPETGVPRVSRVAFGLDAEGTWLTLVSTLATHTAALRAAPRAGLLLGEPPAKGDPLAFPRLSVEVEAAFVSRDDPRHAGFRSAWLSHHPKSALYVDFPDFSFVTLTPRAADLNGGFGKAFRLTAGDLAPADETPEL